MASHAHLSDAEIAAVLSYVRSSFGNQSSPITEAEVAATRANNTTE
jgi:mono/diheme cytochrome c family protein